MKKLLILCVLFLLNCPLSIVHCQLIVYSSPQGVALNNDFTVKARAKGGAWQAVATYLVKVDEVRNTKHHEELASMASFDFDGEVEVSVTFNKGKISTARVRPLSYGITARVIDEHTLTFTLDRPHNLSVEVNGDIFHNLHLFANPLETEHPQKGDKNVIYFDAGIHQIENGAMKISSGTTVYLAGGAVLMGKLLVDRVRDVRIIGRGIIDHSVKAGIEIRNSKNVYVEGIITTQIPTGGSDSVTIRNCKVISYYGWGDGLNVFASSNVLFDGVFCRNSDDCTTVYATRKGFDGSARNIVMQNSTLWADVAHPILIGTHGSTPNRDTIEHVVYRNIDILDHKEAQLDYQGCMSINAGDNNLIRDITFENIRVEDFRQGQLLNLRVFYNSKYCTSPGRAIENIAFRNVSYNGSHAELSVIAGYNEERKVRNITFENLRINGHPIFDDMPEKPKWYKTSDMARIFVGEHVENIKFYKNEK